MSLKISCPFTEGHSNSLYREEQGNNVHKSTRVGPRKLKRVQGVNTVGSSEVVEYILKV